MIELTKYLRGKGFVCSYKSADRVSLWKTTGVKPYYWQVDLGLNPDESTWIKITKYSDEDRTFSEVHLQNAVVNSIAEIAVLIQILKITE